MPINVILGAEALEIYEAVSGDLIDTVAYQSIDTIAYTYNPGTIVNASTLGATPVLTGTPQWYATVWLRDQRKVIIQLGDVANQAGWTNNQTGFDQLVDDIYGAFPAAGPPGSGTVTSVGFDPGTTGFAQAVGPITDSGTFLLTGFAAVRASNTLFVDDVVGNDTTGTRGRYDLPYLTFAGAVADAQEGDCIQFRPGTYAIIADGALTPVALFIYLEPGVFIAGIDLNDTQSIWTVRGEHINGDVFVDGFGTTLYIEGGVVGNVEVTNIGAAFITGNITGDLTLEDGSTAYLYGGWVTNVILEDASTFNASGVTIVANLSTTSTGTINGYGTRVGGVITGVTIVGDVFSDNGNTPGTVATVNADGSWSWGIDLAAALAGKADASAVPPCYAAILNQTGTDDPVATVLLNTLGGAVVWTRFSQGTYVGTLTGAFPATKTLIVVNGSSPVQLLNGTLTELSRTTDDTLAIFTSDGGVAVDGQLINTGFKLEVYP